LSPLALDNIIFFLTLWRLWKLGQLRKFRKEVLIQVLLRDGIMYYVVICTINVLNVINTFAGPKTIRQFGVNFSVALSTIMACRLILNLQGLQPVMEETEEEEQFSDADGGVMTSIVAPRSQQLFAVVRPQTSFRLTGESWNILRSRVEEDGIADEGAEEEGHEMSLQARSRTPLSIVV